MYQQRLAAGAALITAAAPTAGAGPACLNLLEYMLALCDIRIQIGAHQLLTAEIHRFCGELLRRNWSTGPSPGAGASGIVPQKRRSPGDPNGSSGG